jgi:phytoene dehydrogenase-like protein
VNDPDVVVIGAGPNGLVAANVLADHGWDVLVLEAEASPGGAVRSQELIEAGFVNDVCSAFYPLGAASPVLAGLELERHGLRWRESPLVLAHPALDGTCPTISRDIDETADSLEHCHADDGSGWRRLLTRWSTVEADLLDALLMPFPPVGATLRLARDVPPSEWTEFTRFLLLPARAMGSEYFRGAAARRLLAGAALHADLAPEATLSGFFGWLMCCLGQRVGFPVPEGGAGQLTAALVQRLHARGGEVRCGHAVEQVIVRDGVAEAVRVRGGMEIRARRAVLADVSAPVLYGSLVRRDDLSSRFVASLKCFAWDNGTVKVDWNLEAPIPWDAPDARRAATVHLAEGVDELTQGSADLACGRIPQDPFLILGQQSPADETRQPPGKETAWAYTHVPHPSRRPGVRVGTETYDGLVERIEEKIEAHAPGFRSQIRGRHVFTPLGFQEENPSLVGGALNAGTAQLHQQLVFRPVPGLGRAETPIRNLFLASASAHPGGGVHGAPGANAAKAAMRHEFGRRARNMLRQHRRRPPA